MDNGRATARLNKRFIVTHEGFDVYAVNPYAVRDRSHADEEFANFATNEEFPDLIPKGEIWVGERNVDKEGIFFIANALTRMTERQRGASPDKAYTAGINVERSLRGRLVGVKFRAGRPHRRVPARIYVRPYITLPDPRFPVEVWLVDGNLVRSFYKTDYTEGGHGYVYRWCPRDQIWIEEDLDAGELPYIVSHEYMELRLMRDRKIEYDPAHEICARLEFAMRQGKGIKPLVAPGRRKPTKRDLPRLTRDEVFQYVVRTYLRKS